MELKDRLLKGLSYFRAIPPSKFNSAHYVHFKTYLDLVEEFINGEEVKKDQFEEAKEVFDKA